MLFSKKVVLDTNFLMIPGQFKVDIFEEIRRVSDFNYKLFIFEKTLKELEKLAEKGKTRDKTAAKIAKLLVSQKKISILTGDEDENVDEQILDYAKKHDCVIATLDGALLKRIRKANPKTRFMILRSKRHLEIV